ncbi:hypothetical protein [Hymenobacter sp. 5414T-23]|uniref:hypothetical protein n=1 Tax=Hymenobacter sp. 5414T-23 TaxID=2932252 RepID=UPI001FD57A6F|nr:hypothetical protein [Hymenobacter sp. 5414T-23]UOQ81656.1 hypothetical protein MUN83_02345 [Hymenobacter sp. 5414T-23]
MSNPIAPSISSASTDPHSFAQPQDVSVHHLALNLTVDFDARVLAGHATWQLANSTGATELLLDARSLQIEEVLLGGLEGEPTSFTLGSEDAVLGQPLRIVLEPGTEAVTIRYRTTPGAAALQWLTPEQTAGREHPFLFTQSQAILARTWIPCQDSPGVRFTYEAQVQVPAELLALMSAENPQQRSATGTYHFRMDQPIPAYLMALAVGNLEFQALSPGPAYTPSLRRCQLPPASLPIWRIWWLLPKTYMVLTAGSGMIYWSCHLHFHLAAWKTRV